MNTYQKIFICVLIGITLLIILGFISPIIMYIIVTIILLGFGIIFFSFALILIMLISNMIKQLKIDLWSRLKLKNTTSYLHNFLNNGDIPNYICLQITSHAGKRFYPCEDMLSWTGFISSCKSPESSLDNQG